MHQVRALVSCIQPGLVICFTLDNIHVLMLFSWTSPLNHVFSHALSIVWLVVSLLRVKVKERPVLLVVWNREQWTPAWKSQHRQGRRNIDQVQCFLQASQIPNLGVQAGKTILVKVVIQDYCMGWGLKENTFLRSLQSWDVHQQKKSVFIYSSTFRNFLKSRSKYQCLNFLNCKGLK